MQYANAATSSSSASTSGPPSNSPPHKRSRPNAAPSLPTPAPKSTVGSALKPGSKPRVDSTRSRGADAQKQADEEPDYAAGVKYWEGVEGSVDGVLGGYGTGVRPVCASHTLLSHLTDCDGDGRPRNQSTER